MLSPMLEYITLCLAGAAFYLAYLGVRYYRQDRAEIRAFFAEAKPVIASIKEKADDDAYIADIAGKAMASYIPPDAVYDMGRGIAQHVAEGALPYVMDRVEAAIPNIIASAFSSDLARDLQSKSAAARSIVSLDGNVKGKQALQFGLQKLLGGVNIPLDQVIAGYQALSELKGQKSDTGNGSQDMTGGVVIDYGPPKVLEAGGQT